ncbi:hypothetical protein EGH25_09550 [Haladaptatus sp. F3-133]|uniref:Uncharacterized protein n=1 Tax=Halorutilus salinus TaxID=2487751 RepID=A0A9Q4GJV5_9EURY|nr:hypothetical protein [Halorutilus salinus]MCX2819591.1 hypothetical protein [Halorutilus salinus]
MVSLEPGETQNVDLSAEVDTDNDEEVILSVSTEDSTEVKAVSTGDRSVDDQSVGGLGGGSVSPANFTEQTTVSVSSDDGRVEVEVTNTGVSEGDTTVELVHGDDVVDTAPVRSLPGYLSEIVSLSYGSVAGEYEVVVDGESIDTFTVEDDGDDTENETEHGSQDGDEASDADDTSDEEIDNENGTDGDEEATEAGGVDDGNETETDGGENLPGFTAVAVVLALIGMLAYRNRR